MKVPVFLFALHALVLLLLGFHASAIADSEKYTPRGPIVKSFELDMNFGGITLNFDQDILASSLDTRMVSLQSTRTDISSNYSLFNFVHVTGTDLESMGNTSTVEFFFHRDDFARLVIAMPSIASNSENTFLSMPSGAALSSFGSPSAAIESNASLPVSQYIPDFKIPYVRSFGLDMDAGQMTIEFTEPMNPYNFTLNGVALQDQANGLYTEKYVRLVSKGVDCNNTMDYNRIFVCDLGRENLDNIKNVNDLCTANTTTFLSIHEPFASDMAGNLVMLKGFSRIFGMMTSNYSVDISPPELLQWSIDLNLGTVTLYFSESIYMPLFNYSGIVICNRMTLQASTTTMRVSDPVISSYENTPTIVVQLNDDQFNFLKFSEDIATGDGSTDTYLFLEPDLARDTSLNQNQYLGSATATPNGTIPISQLTQDFLDPVLLYATVDMTNETLSLFWDEVVSISSINLEEFFLQSAREVLVDTEVLTIPSTSDLITLHDSKVLVFSLRSIFSQLKSKSTLCRSVDTCFVSFTYRFLDDQSGNNVVSIPSSRARQVVSYVPDYNFPFLLSWAVDMDRGELVLTFSEPIDVDNFHVAGIRLSNRANSLFGSNYIALTASSSLVADEDQLRVELSYADSNSLKSSTSICRDEDSCFLSLTSVDGDFAGYDVPTFDLSGNTVQNAIHYDPGMGMAPSSFLLDTSSPVLWSFDVDLDKGCLFLTFSEPVQVKSWALNASGISLFSNISGDVRFMLSLSDETFCEDGQSAAFVKLVLTRQDFFRVKEEGRFGRDALSSGELLLSVTNTTFMDPWGNRVDGGAVGLRDSANSRRFDNNFPSVVFLAAVNYTEDSSGAAIVACSSVQFQPSTNITIYFDDAISIDSLSSERIFLASFEAIRTVSLNDGLLQTFKTSSSEVTFSTIPIASSISATTTVLSSQYHSYVYASGTTVYKDAYDNWNRPMQAASAVRVGGSLLYFRLDMSAHLLSFEMVYPISISLQSVDAAQMRLFNSKTGTDLTFSGVIDLYTSDSGHFVFLKLSSSDVARIQARQILGQREDIKLDVGSAAMTDSSGVQLNASTTLACSQLIDDDSAPSISSVVLNLGTGLLSITFSEHVVVSSVDVSRLGLTDAAVDGNLTVFLMHAAVTTETAQLSTSDYIEIDLNAGGVVPNDRDRIHLSGGVGQSPDQTYLLVAPGFVHDTRPFTPNFLDPILPENARPVDTLVPDTVPPKLISYKINLSERSFTLVFNEAINPSSITPSKFVFLPSTATPNSNLFSFGEHSSVSEETLLLDATKTVEININASDMDEIMSRYPVILSSAENTRLAFPSGVARDIAYSSNSIEEVFNIYALPPSRFVTDSVPPTLLWYDVSIQNRLVRFRFDEMVNCFYTDVTKLWFQYRDFSGNIENLFYFTANSTLLSNCDISTAFSREVTIKIGYLDLLSIKLIPQLMKTAAATNLGVERGAFADVMGNDILPLRDGHTLNVRQYEGDLVRPELTGFSISRQGLMFLKFSEPMSLASLQFTKISLIDNRTDAPFELPLQDPPSSFLEANPNRDLLTLYITKQFQLLLDTTKMFSRQDSVYITFSSDMASDAFGNEVVERSNLTATNVGPGIDGWALDMNNHHLYVYFSEPVFENFSTSSVVLQNAADSPTRQLRLMDASHFQIYDHRPFHSEGMAFVATLSSRDIDQIKTSNLLMAGEVQSLFLWAPAGFARSSLSSSFLPYLNSTETLQGIEIDEFFPDSTGPSILKVTLDLNAGQLKMLFDEPVVGKSVDVTKLSLLSDTSGNSIVLTGLNDLVDQNSSSLVLNLTMADQNSAKYSYSYGTLDRVRCEVAFVMDVFGNFLEGDAQYAYQEVLVSITSFIPDSTPPELLSFSVDLSSLTIDIVFDELIEHWSISPVNIQLLSSDNASDPETEFFSLSNYSVIIGDPSARKSNITVDLALLRRDAFRLQSEGLIGKNVSSTFLHISGVVDIAGNERHSNTSIIQVSSIIDDLSRPELEAFDLDIGATATATLYFSEIMDIDSFSCDEFYFASEMTVSPSETLSLSSCTVLTATNSREISVTVSSALFASLSIGSAPTSTFLYAPFPVKNKDPSGNVLKPLDPYLAKMVGAQVVGSILDLRQNGTLDLIFSKNISRPSFDANKVGFHSLATNEEYFLEGVNPVSGFFETSPESDFIVSMTFSGYSLVRFKNIGVGNGQVLVLINASCAVDDDDVDVALASAREHKKVTKFLRDFDPPLLRSLAIDMSASVIAIEFSEPLLLSSVQTSGLTLLSTPGELSNASVYSYSFTGGSFSYEILDTTILYSFQMSNRDFGAVKLMSPNLATDLSNAYLAIGVSTFADMFGNSYPTVDPVDALPFTSFIDDTQGPSVDYFMLDMDLALLTIVCTEPIAASSVNVSAIVLQSRYYGGKNNGLNLQYRLQENSSSVISPNDFSVVIQLGDEDVYGIRNTPNLARKIISTYMILSSEAATDLAGNEITAIPDGEAYRAKYYTADFTRPVVTGIDLDLSLDRVTFSFSETIWTTKANIRALRIQVDSSSDVELNYDFQEESNKLANQDQTFSTSLIFELGLHDLNAIKSRYPLGSSIDTTFFAWTDGLVTDVFMNPVEASANSSATPVDSYTPDRNAPTLLSYHLDMNALKIFLEFSESIELPATHLEQGLLQNTLVKRFGNYVNLSRSSITGGDDLDSNLVEIQIDNATATIMKYNEIARTRDTSFLSYGSEFVADVFSNYIHPLWDGSVLDNYPRLPDIFVKDSTSPTLTRWFVDREDARLYFVFSEPVRLSDCSGISFSFASGFNASVAACSGEYDQYATRWSFRLLAVAADECGSSEPNATASCEAEYHLTYSSRAPAEVSARLLQLSGTLDSAYLSLSATSFEDFAYPANSLSRAQSIAPSGPDCSECPVGMFMSASCTSSSDRECAPCSTCGDRHWQAEKCTLTRDVQCIACSDCPYGTYISKECFGESDTQCSPCTRCKELEVETRECVKGLDSICDSCERCSFDGEPQFIKKACETTEKYHYWRNENCCTTQQGKTVPCDVAEVVRVDQRLGLNTFTSSI